MKLLPYLFISVAWTLVVIWWVFRDASDIREHIPWGVRWLIPRPKKQGGSVTNMCPECGELATHRGHCSRDWKLASRGKV